MFVAAGLAGATGLTIWKPGDASGWQSQDALKKQLSDNGWKVRRIKIDGGCYEVYAINDKGDRVEAYFHPVTFKPILTINCYGAEAFLAEIKTVWDPFVRLLHWSLVAGVTVAWLTEDGLDILHDGAGYLVIIAAELRRVWVSLAPTTRASPRL
jgi:hypothetical protein